MSRRHLRLNLRRWRAVRRVVLDRDNWRCVACGRPGRLEVDHRVPLHVDPDQDAYDPAGCQALCRPCHFAKTSAENKRPPRSPAEAAWRDLASELLE